MSSRYRFGKESENDLEPSFSSPLMSPVGSPSSSISLSMSRSNSSSSIVMGSGSVSPHDSRSISPVPSHSKLPRESTKLPVTYSMDEDKDDYGHRNGHLSMSDVFSDYSVERSRCGTANGDGEHLKSNETVELDLNDNSQLSYKHIQYLLDDNKKLIDEVNTLKGKFNVLNGDNVNLTYQLQQSELKCQAKNAKLIELEGKISALSVQLKSESEAKIEVQAKYSLAESTIDSLNRQIGVMAKSDYSARLRENYEDMLNKLRNQHEAEMIVSNGENEGLKYQLEMVQSENDTLKVQLLEKDKALASTEADKLSNLKDIKQKYEEIMRETFNKSEYESILKRKNDEIEALLRENSLLRNNSSNSSSNSVTDTCKCGRKLSTSQSESEYVKELKMEFEKSLANLQSRRTQINALQTQLAGCKKEILELKERLRASEKSKGEKDEFLKIAHEPLIKEIEARYAAKFDRDLKEAIRVMDKTQREEIERCLNGRLERYVNQLIKYLDSLYEEDQPEHEFDQFDDIFTPLKKLWLSINCNLEDRLNVLEQKQEAVLEAKDSLAKVLNESKSIDTSVPQSDIINQELEKLNEEVNQLKSKLDKYKRHYHRLIDKHEREIAKLKDHYVKVVAEREREYIRREAQLIEELSDDPLKCRRLSSFVNNSTKDDR